MWALDMWRNALMVPHAPCAGNLQLCPYRSFAGAELKRHCEDCLLALVHGYSRMLAPKRDRAWRRAVSGEAEGVLPSRPSFDNVAYSSAAAETHIRIGVRPHTFHLILSHP